MSRDFSVFHSPSLYLSQLFVSFLPHNAAMLVWSWES